MRILVMNWQDREHPQAGGAETHLHEIFGRIARMGHDVTLLACGFDGAPSTTELDGMRVIRIGDRRTFNYSALLWWMRSGRHMAPDVVVDDINKIPLMTPLFVKRPIVGIIHHLFGDSIFREAGRLAGTYVSTFERLIPRVYRTIPIAVVSESTRTECVELGLPAKNLSVIYNGIEPKEFPMRVGPKAEVPTIVYFGRLKRYKSVDHVVRAFARVRERIPEARLQIIGRGDDLPYLEDVVRSTGCADHVTFRGWVSGPEKIDHLSAAHVVINPSVKEGWGITNLEANACGTPVISADSPGLRDSVHDGVSGLLYPYGSIDDLTDAIVRVLTNSELRSHLSEGAVQWAASFTWDASAQAMLTLLERAAASRL